MQNIEIRLECLKLAHRPDRSPNEVIAQAREYLSWIGGSLNQTTAEKQPGDSLKASNLPPKNALDKAPK